MMKMCRVKATLQLCSLKPSRQCCHWQCAKDCYLVIIAACLVWGQPLGVASQCSFKIEGHSHRAETINGSASSVFLKLNPIQLKGSVFRPIIASKCQVFFVGNGVVQMVYDCGIKGPT